MASTQQVPIPSENEMLSDLYLALWEQLDLISGEGKWLDIRPPDASDLAVQAQRGMNELERRLSDTDALKQVRNDFEHTQRLLSSKSAPAAFKDYLRDQGLRYAESAAEE